jgi:hypothetical protein
MKNSIYEFFFGSLESKHEVAIMYFGRACTALTMTSERMVIPEGVYTLEQVLNRLRERGEQWAEELDGSHVLCTVDGEDAGSFDVIEVGAEICISSRKSIFEP